MSTTVLWCVNHLAVVCVCNGLLHAHKGLACITWLCTFKPAAFTLIKPSLTTLKSSARYCKLSQAFFGLAWYAAVLFRSTSLEANPGYLCCTPTAAEQQLVRCSFLSQMIYFIKKVFFSLPLSHNVVIPQNSLCLEAKIKLFWWLLLDASEIPSALSQWTAALFSSNK